jgi:hypothetical protein
VLGEIAGGPRRRTRERQHVPRRADAEPARIDLGALDADLDFRALPDDAEGREPRPPASFRLPPEHLLDAPADPFERGEPPGPSTVVTRWGIHGNLLDVGAEEDLNPPSFYWADTVQPEM